MRTAVGWASVLIGSIVLAPIFGVAAALVLISACTRIVARLIEPSSRTWEQLIDFDPVVGWKPRPNVRTYHLMGDLFRVSTDAQGWRGRSSLSDSDVVVFGDSFAAGYGVDDRHLFADLNPRLRIKPIGIGGYSMVQALLWMKELAPSLRGKLIVWFVYLGNDLRDNLSPELRGYRKPFLREHAGEWEIVSSHVTPEKWPIIVSSRKAHIHMVTLAELCADTFFATRAYRACDFLLRTGRHICAEAGAELMVLSIPDRHQLHPDGHAFLKSLLPEDSKFDPDLPDRRVAEMCQRLGVPFVAGNEFLDVNCYKANDCHWNEVGHRRIATRLAELHSSHRKNAVRVATKVDYMPAQSELARATKTAG
jgi:phosphate/sulfate permease